VITERPTAWTQVSEREGAACVTGVLAWGLSTCTGERRPEARPLTWGNTGRQLHKKLRHAHRHLHSDAAGRRPMSCGPRSTVGRARRSRSIRTALRMSHNDTDGRPDRTPVGPRPVADRCTAQASDRMIEGLKTTTYHECAHRLGRPRRSPRILATAPDLARCGGRSYLSVEQLESGGPDGVGAVRGRVHGRDGDVPRCAEPFRSPRNAARTGSRSGGRRLRRPGHLGLRAGRRRDDRDLRWKISAEKGALRTFRSS